jgi:hypothetical protein
MFAALCNNGDFFKQRANGYILIAPVSRCENLMSPWCQKMKTDKKAFEFLKS